MNSLNHTLWSRENKRNADNKEVFEQVIREAYGDVVIFAAGHHLMFTREGSPDTEEIPSADTLMFSHFIAEKIWGVKYKTVLIKLALEPIATRDLLFCELYANREL